MEWSKIDEKDKIMENRHAMFQMIEAVIGRRFWNNAGVLKKFAKMQGTSVLVLESLFNKAAGF